MSGKATTVEARTETEWRITKPSLFLMLLGLFGIGIAQPFFGLVGENPTFFVAHRSSTADIVLLTLLVFIGPAVFAWLLAVGFERIAPRLARRLIPLALAALAAVAIAGYLWRPLDMQIELALPIVLVLMAVLWFGLRIEQVRMLVRNLGWISFVFPAMFLLLSPVSGLLGSSEDTDTLTGSLADASTDTSVALIVFDELPLVTMLDAEGRIDSGRLPNFARLGEMSTWYPNTTTVSTQTSVAVPSILTGEFQADAPAPTVASYPSNLFTELATTHRIEAWESVTRLCPTEVCDFPDLGWGLLLDDSLIIIQNQILPPGVAQRLVPSVNNQWTRFRQPKVTRPRGVTADDEWEFPWDDLEQDLQGQFRSLTSLIGTHDEPTFYYEHVLLPHSPWYFRPDGSGNEAEWIPWLEDNVWPTGADHERGILMYAMHLELADTLLGEFLDSVEATGRFDDLLLVVVADHGVGLQAGLPSRTATPATMAELVTIPLFIKYPGQSEGAIDDRPAEIIDVYPTIAGTVGLGGLPDSVVGEPLNEPAVPGRTQRIPIPEEEFWAAVDRFQAIVPPGASAEPLFDAFQARGQ